MNSKSKKNNRIGIVIIIIGILILAGIIIYTISVNKDRVYIFTTGKSSMGQKLLDNINIFESEESYPETVKQVVDLYTDTLMITYGDYLVHEPTQKHVIEIQRKLYSKDMLEKNPLDAQFDKLLLDLAELRKMEIVSYIINSESPFYNPNDNSQCIVRVIQKNRRMKDPLYWNLYLGLEENKWKITSIQPSDEEFQSSFK